MRSYYSYLLALSFFIFFSGKGYSQSDLSFKSLLSYPEPANLTSNASRLAWTFNEEGRRNIYVADAVSDYESKKITTYMKDDGQEITSLSISNDGNWLVYVRGGEHGGNWSGTLTVNPESLYSSPKVEVWSVPFKGGKPVLLGVGSYPKISPNNKDVVFLRSGQVWIAPIDGSQKAKRLFTDRGTVRQLDWSPDGSKIAFSSSRKDTHSFIGVYSKDKKSIEWLSPDLYKDIYPKWSPDGNSITFIRLPGSTTQLDSILVKKHEAWEIRVGDMSSLQSQRIWKAPETLRGSIPTTQGRYNLNWMAKDRITFVSYHDGWPHLYCISSKGGKELLLTPGEFMVEEISFSEDKEKLVFSVNTGDSDTDIDRRHIATVSVDRVDMQVITSGNGVESTPAFIEKDHSIAFLSSTTNRPALPAILTQGKKDFQLLASEKINAEFPSTQMVSPKQVVYKAPDGTSVHAQLFEKEDGRKNKPAIVFVHGGPQRQVLLAWDHRGYYAHTYALNQYLANQGYVVLSVNYRLGIGYGYEFHKPEHGGRYGASEYQDVKAAGEWLANKDNVDAKKIGIYGGSYGGYLTAMALGRDSDLFSTGVDIHGVHTRVPSAKHALLFEKAPDAEEADEVAWLSSPIAYVDTWTSPVLLIHADDDRNVGFAHSVDLAQRLEKKGVYFESLVIPDDTHHWMLHKNLIKISEATVDFFDRKLKNGPVTNGK